MVTLSLYGNPKLVYIYMQLCLVCAMLALTLFDGVFCKCLVIVCVSCALIIKDITTLAIVEVDKRYTKSG